MILDFNTMETTVLPRFKGGEKEMTARMFWDGTNRIFRGLLEPGASIGEHVHDVNCEMLFVIEGEGTLIDDGVPSPISKGMCAYCPKGHTHSLVNTSDGPLEFYAAVPAQ